MEKTVRTTIWVNEKNLRKIKHVAIDEKTSVSKLLDKLISDYLDKK